MILVFWDVPRKSSNRFVCCLSVNRLFLELVKSLLDKNGNHRSQGKEQTVIAVYIYFFNFSAEKS